jgi:hypothetical protein
MPCFFSSFDQFGDHLGFLNAERRGRFVHDQDLGVEIDRAADRHRLPLPAGQPGDGRMEAPEVRVEPAHDLAGLGFHLGIVDKTQRAW